MPLTKVALQLCRQLVQQPLMPRVWLCKWVGRQTAASLVRMNPEVEAIHQSEATNQDFAQCRYV